MELRFIRDIDKREVDFVVLRDGHAEFAVECKTVSAALLPPAGTSEREQIFRDSTRYIWAQRILATQ